MTSNKRLILLNGFAGSGKSTIAKRYIQEHPLAINIEGDEIIGMLGEWKENYDEARKCVFPLTKSLAKTHLALGNDVVIPYLLINSSEAGEFEKLTKKANAQFSEIFLFNEKNVAVSRLMKRGTWGEEGMSRITKEEIPEIKDLYDKMIIATLEERIQLKS